MANEKKRGVFIWLLVAAVVVSGALATKVELDRRRLSAAYTKAQEELAQLEQERQVQPQDQVEGSAHEVAELALASIVDDPAVAPTDPRLDTGTQLLDGRFAPVRFVLD